jgi:hypothetical protein
MTHHDDAVKVAPDSYKVVLENDGASPRSPNQTGRKI